MTLKCRGLLPALVALLSTAMAPSPLHAQIRVDFSTTDPGVVKSIPHWGLDTNWASLDNMRRGLSYMGVENVNVVRVPGMVDKPADVGLTAEQREHLQLCKDLAGMARPDAKWNMCAPGSDTVHAWYQTGPGTVNVERWVTAMRLSQEFYNRPLWMVEPFNEPDYPEWGEGSMQNLADIMTALQALPQFAGAAMGGGSTMSVDRAKEWFDALGGKAKMGTTHCLYGSVANYQAFIEHVTASGGMPVNPEGHNVVEAIIGAHYGLQCMIWWGTAERARGEFLRASQGVRLGYAEHRPSWSAAAVYRAPDGSIKAFLGSSERVGGTSTYTFHSTDRDVYYDGHGPQRDYTVTIARDQERVVNITLGPDAPPPIGGRYVLVNEQSGLCLEVTDAATNNGAPLRQNAFTGARHQLWDIAALAANNIGDLSFFTIGNVNSGLYVDLPDWNHAENAVIKQYGYPANSVEHWYFEYAGNGRFHIRSRWSNKCLAVSQSTPAAGAAVVQRTFASTPDQLWRLQSPDTPPATPLQITAGPQSLTAATGQTMTFSVNATGTGRLAYQWQRDGVPIAGATAARLVLPNVQPVDAGAYAVAVSDTVGSTTSAAATLTVVNTADIGRLVNLSIRSNAGTADQTLIVGFGIGGPAGTKTVLVRGIGPTLGSVGVAGALSASKLDLYAGQTMLQTGTAWGGSAALQAAFDAVGAFPLNPASKDAAFLPTLPAGATYTTQLTGVGGTTGVALMELYDAATSFDATTTPRLVNASARTQVGTADQVLIAGFAIGGATARTVLIRAAGPALAPLGVSGTLTAPKLTLIHGATELATNAGWAGDGQISAASDAVGAFAFTNPLSKDSALLLTLPPGTYTAKVSGADNGTGIALVEVYDVP